MDDSFTIQDWKVIIINFLAIQDQRIKFPNWKWVAAELNVYVKCDQSLRENLKNWYAQYTTSTEFPPKALNLPGKLLPAMGLQANQKLDRVIKLKPKQFLISIKTGSKLFCLQV